MYNWERRNVQWDGRVDVFYYFGELSGCSLSLWVLHTAASYNVSKPPGAAGVFPQQRLHVLAGEASIAEFCSEMLIFPRKKWRPACLGGGCLPVECFFHRKGFLYQVLILQGEEEKTVSSQLGQSSEFIPGFIKYEACHILPYSAKKDADKLTAVWWLSSLRCPCWCQGCCHWLLFPILRFGPFSVRWSHWEKKRLCLFFVVFVHSVALHTLNPSLGRGWMGAHRTGMAARPTPCNELLLFSLNTAM